MMTLDYVYALTEDVATRKGCPEFLRIIGRTYSVSSKNICQK
jgi:hypothetical protein